MINTLRMFDELQETMDVAAAKKIAEIIGLVYEDLQHTATKADLNDVKNDLKDVIIDLGLAQQNTEKRMEQLAEAQNRTEIKVEELAEAQKRTEVRIEELAEAQKRTEVRVEELAEAQKRTENRVEELAGAQKELTEAQKRTEIKLKELAEAQKRTEAKVEELAEAMKELALAQTRTQKEVGGLSMTIGYRLEDAAYQSLPALLQRDYGILVHERLNRRYVQDGDNHDIEVNIFGKASRQHESLIILGESKAQLSKNDIDRFLRKKFDRLKKRFPNMFPVLITYMTSESDVEAYAKRQGIALYYSYDFEQEVV